AALLTVVGFASITFLTTGNSTVQLAARPDMRGRMTALWSTAFVGSTPIGATIIGAIGDTSPRLALIVGAAACGAAAIAGLGVSPRSTRRRGWRSSGRVSRWREPPSPRIARRGFRRFGLGFWQV